MSRKINKQRWFATSLLVATMTLTLSQYTNCAPPPAGVEPEVASPDSEVRIVDDWNGQPIAFLKSYQEIPSDERSLTLDGLCGRKSQGIIKWAIVGREDISGQGLCELGGFRIEVSEIENLSCGKTYYLKAITENEDSATIYVSKNCSG